MGSTSSRREAKVSVSQEKFVSEVKLPAKQTAKHEMGDDQQQPRGRGAGKVPLPPLLPPCPPKLQVRVPKLAATSDDNDKEEVPSAGNSDILLKFKRQYRSSYVYLSECEKISRALRSLREDDDLASEAAFFKADQLAEFSVKVSREKEHLEVVTNFLVAVGLPQLLVESMRSLNEEHSGAVSYDREKVEVSGEMRNKEEKDNLSQQTKFAQDVMSSLSNATLNFTDSHDEFCEICSTHGMIDICLSLVEAMKDCIPDMLQFKAGGTNMIDQYTERGKFLFRVMGVLHNLAKRPLNKKLFNKCNVIPVLLPLIKVPVMTYAVEALLTVAYLVNEKNNDLIMADQEPMRMIIQMLDGARKSNDHRYHGFTATEIASGLRHLASNGKNNRMIGQHGGIPILASMMKDARSEEETEAATKALYTLVFDEGNRDFICNDEATMETLRQLQSSDNQAIRHTACGVLWEIEGKRGVDQQAEVPEPSKRRQKKRQRKPISQREGKTSARPQHIMISYQWDSQVIMLQVKENLQQMGLDVWLDLDKMGGSILEAMARAVENASVVLLGVSQKYQNIPNCRSEAEYAYQIRKPIIPLMMETDYQPDGWLGIIVGTKLWMDFRGNVESGLSQLSKELKQHLQGEDIVGALVSEESPLDLAQGNLEKVSDWRKEDVARWFEDIGLPAKGNNVRERLDGPLLIQLHRLRRESPAFFYSSIKMDLGLPTVVEVLQFAEELRKLVG